MTLAASGGREGTSRQLRVLRHPGQGLDRPYYEANEKADGGQREPQEDAPPELNLGDRQEGRGEVDPRNKRDDNCDQWECHGDRDRGGEVPAQEPHALIVRQE